MEKNGVVINWVDGAGDLVEQAREIIKRDVKSKA
jgi:hypothetical protein